METIGGFSTCPDMCARDLERWIQRLHSAHAGAFVLLQIAKRTNIQGFECPLNALVKGYRL